MIGTTELLIVAVVVLVLFGASAVPKFARSLGQAKREFEKGSKDGSKENNAEADKEKEAASGGGQDI